MTDERDTRGSGVNRPLSARLKTTVAWVQSLRPVRVLVHFTESHGAILAAGMSFQSLFAIFAAIWVGFSVAGFWISDNPALTNALFDLINQSVPGLIDRPGGVAGVIDPSTLTSARVFGFSGVIALIGLIWTTLGWLSTTTDAVRTLFRMPRDTTFFLWVKLRQLGLGMLFGAALVVSALISLASTEALGFAFALVGLSPESFWFSSIARGIGLLLVLVIDTATLAALFRVLSRLRIPARRLVAGSLLGALALGVLKLLGGTLLGGTSQNPLLAAFAVIAGLLIWFNLVNTVLLLTAAWIAVGMNDAGVTPHWQSEAERLAAAKRAEAAARQALALAELQDAQRAWAAASWLQRPAAARRLRRAARQPALSAVPPGSVPPGSVPPGSVPPAGTPN